jgi:alpha-glucosidase
MATLEAYRVLLGARRASPALATGGLRWLHVGTDSLAFVREHPDESVLIVAARHQSEPVRIPLSDLSGRMLHPLFGFGAEIVAEQVVIDVPSAGAGVWRVEGV